MVIRAFLKGFFDGWVEADLPPHVARLKSSELSPHVGYRWVSDDPADLSVAWKSGHAVGRSQPGGWA